MASGRIVEPINLWNDVIHDESADQPLIAEGNVVRGVSTQLNYVVSKAALPSTACFKFIINGIQERYSCYVGVTSAPSSSWNTVPSTTSWSGCRPDIFAWGIYHQTGIFSRGGVEEFVHLASSTSTQEVLVKVSKHAIWRETEIEFIIKNSGETVHKARATCSLAEVKWYPTVTLRSPSLEVKCVKLTPSEIKEFS